MSRGRREVGSLSLSEQACWLEEKGQAMLEYILVLSVVALPLILVSRQLQNEMAAFLRQLLMTVSLWIIGA
jgi:Flp pilus assembly pilin Flp